MTYSDHNFEARMQLARQVGYLRSTIRGAIRDLENKRPADLLIRSLEKALADYETICK